MGKKNRAFIKTFMCFLMAVCWVIMAFPFMNLADGSFLKVSLGTVYNAAVKYAGFATTPALRYYTLVPAVFLVMLITFDVFIKAGFLTYFSQIIFCASSYILGVLYQKNGDTLLSALVKFPYDVQVITGLAIVSFISLCLLAVLRVKSDLGGTDSPRKKRKKSGELSMTHEEALNALRSLEVPTFDLFQNTGDFEESVSLGSSINIGVFQEAFKVSQIEREAEEKAQLENAQIADEEIVKAFTEEPVEQPEEEPATESQGPEDSEDFEEIENIVRKQANITIIDEGTDPDDEIESAKAQYQRLKDEKEQNLNPAEDFVSAVGGLRSSVNGDYLYDSSKFTYKFPSETLLKHFPRSTREFSNLNEDPDGQTIIETFREFKIDTSLIEVQHGPTFTLYELTLAKGIRVNAVLSLADNIAMELAVPSVRILAPIPGKAAIGVEVPNKQRDTIGFDELYPALKEKTLKVPMVLGKTITGDSVIIDLAGAPHMLIAGTTGSGKSVCVNGLICSILYTKTPAEVRMILVDPKMVELTVYNDIPHLLTPVITEPKKAIKAMQFCIQEMERRMTMFSQIGARKIEDYNQKITEKGILRSKLPYIVVIIDEFADLMMTVGKELESYIKRITAVARFTGIHLVLATQRPSADVITGIIKSNMPTQIAFAVSNQVNSRIILDTIGAEKLLGRGDMLYASASSRVPQRIQGAFIDSEIDSIVSFVKTQGEPDYIDDSFFEDEEEDEDEDLFGTVMPGAGGEDLFTRAWRIVADRGEASASYLQRRLSIGYNRAANLIEQMEDQGIVGPARGSKPREILRYPDSRSETGPLDEA